jgi:hypothetical protein
MFLVSGGTRAMRLVARIVLGMALLAGGSQRAAAEGWWPFGSGDGASARSEANEQAATSQYTPAAQSTTAGASPVAGLPPVGNLPSSVDPDTGWIQVPKPSWPAIHLPEFSSLRPPRLPRANWSSESQVDASRNTWYGETPERPQSSPWQMAQGAAHKVGQRTRSAWHKTVDVFTPGDAESARMARREPPKPPLWKRMLGVEEEKPQGPLTVTEWMAQERLDP